MQMKLSASVIMGIIYCGLGASLFLLYFLILLPLIDSRTQFTREATRHEIIVFGRKLAEKVDEKEKSILEALTPLISRLGITLDSGFFRAAAMYRTDFDNLEKRSRELFERDTPTRLIPSTQPTTTNATVTAPNVSDAQTVSNTSSEPTPAPYLFLAWLESDNYTLYDNWLARRLTSLSTSDLAVRTFIAFCLAAGLFFGGLRLLIAAQREQMNSDIPVTSRFKLILMPWATPVMSLLVLVLLTGFGPILAGPLDPATRRLLVVISMSIGIAPEVFVGSLRKFLVDAARQFLPGIVDTSI